MERAPLDLDAILSSAWDSFEEGARSGDSIHHTPTIATVRGRMATQRTVILRHADRATRHLVFHTDWRAPKVEDLQRGSAVAWHFYSPAARAQLRVESVPTLHHQDEVARAAWDRITPFGRRAYLAPSAPGERSDAPSPNLPPHLIDRAPTAEESAPGYLNFATVFCRVVLIDWLWLASTGHRRARFAFDGREWKGEWAEP